jgi:hypothetical protein
MNWKPIETAPMDGTPFLAWDGNIDMYVVYYSQSHKSLIDQQLGEWPEYYPKLWHPLPPPPTTEQSPTVPMDDDLDEPLGKACSLDNPECESCQ